MTRAARPLAEVLDETIGYHDMLRRLGFAADDLFFTVGTDVGDTATGIGMTVRVRGHEVTFLAGLVAEPVPAIEAAWDAVVDRWNGGADPAWKAAVVAAWKERHDLLRILAALHTHGLIVLGDRVQN